jgi:excisionase family DNA binding protein
MKEHLLERPDKANIIGCIETYEADPAFTASAPEKRCYTVDELQIILACGRETVYSLLKKNEFRWFRVGGGNGVYRISKKSFDEWLDARI